MSIKNKLFTVLGRKFEFSAQDSGLEYLCWQCKNSPVSSDLKPPLVTVVVVSGFLVDISIATKSYSSFGSSLPVRDRLRFFDQVGHQTTSAYIENKHFFTKSCHRQTYQNYEQPLQSLQNLYVQSHFSASKIS